MPVCLFNELFVANLATDCTEEEVTKFFAAHGTVIGCWIGYKTSDDGTCTSCFASVRMRTNEEASTARKTLNGCVLKDRKLVVKWAANQRLLWIGNLPENVTDEVLRRDFVHFGCVEQAVVVAEAKGSPETRHGFVMFKDKKAAKKAMNLAEGGCLPYEGCKVEWARVESHSTPAPSPAAPKQHLPPGFVCICSHKSVQLDGASFTRDTHDRQLHEEMEVDKYKQLGANVQTMYLPGGGLMAVNPSRRLVIGARAHRMAVFMGQLTNYEELVAKYGINQPAPTESGRKRSYNVSELLCILYSKLGLSMLSELEGKFAFCMYDPRLVRVLAVRDVSGTFPVVQAYTQHNHLIIVCGPYFPEDHREEIILEPSQYKYGWHAPPLYYEGKLAALPPVLEEAVSDLATSEEAPVKKKRTRRGRKGKKNLLANQEGQGEEEEVLEGENAQVQKPSLVVDVQDASLTPAADAISSPAATTPGKRRRRRRRSKSASPTAGCEAQADEEADEDADAAEEDNQNVATQVAVKHVAPGLAANVEEEDISFAAFQQGGLQEDEEEGIGELDEADPTAKCGRRRRRRRRSGRNSTCSSQRSSMDLSHEADSQHSAEDVHKDSSHVHGQHGTRAIGSQPVDIHRGRMSHERARRESNWWPSHSSADREREMSGSWRSSLDHSAPKWGAGSWRSRHEPRSNAGSWRAGSQDDHMRQPSWRASLDGVRDHGSRHASVSDSWDHKSNTGMSWRSNHAMKDAASDDAASRPTLAAGAVRPAAVEPVATEATLQQGVTPAVPVPQQVEPKHDEDQELLESAGKQERVFGLSSHRISVGHDLESLGNMLAAGLAAAPAGNRMAVRSMLAEAVAAMKPSRSCGELTALHNAKGHGPTWVW